MRIQSCWVKAFVKHVQMMSVDEDTKTEASFFPASSSSSSSSLETMVKKGIIKLKKGTGWKFPNFLNIIDQVMAWGTSF